MIKVIGVLLILLALTGWQLKAAHTKQGELAADLAIAQSANKALEREVGDKEFQLELTDDLFGVLQEEHNAIAKQKTKLEVALAQANDACLLKPVPQSILDGLLGENGDGI